MINAKFDESFFPKLTEWKAQTNCYIEVIDLMYEIPVIIRAKKVLELGIGSHAISTKVFLKALKKTGGQLISVEIDPNNSYSTHPDIDTSNWLLITADDRNINMHGEFDILMIDTSHEYEHTKFELNRFVPLLRKGGYLYMHDTNEGGVSKALLEYMQINPDLLEVIHMENHVPTMTILLKN